MGIVSVVSTTVHSANTYPHNSLLDAFETHDALTNLLRIGSLIAGGRLENQEARKVAYLDKSPKLNC